MLGIVPNLHFDGCSAEAMALYRAAFGAQTSFVMHYADADPKDLRRPLNEAEMAAVERVQEIFHSKRLIPCTSCRYRTDGCPQHISIPDLFAIMNTKQLYHDWNADDYYSVVHTAPGRRASDCLK